MNVFTFTGLGTNWSITTDGENITNTTEEAVLSLVQNFENRFSRFLPESESNVFREALAGVYTVSSDLKNLLDRATLLQKLTNGLYDPALGKLMEHTGYNKDYTLKPEEGVQSFNLPKWSLEGNALTIDGPIVFDFGGIGKGYCIDMIVALLREKGHEHFLVEGGGDMYGTSKKSGEGFRIALEWPGNPEKAFGVVELKNESVAVSDSFRRRWGDWHHIIDPQNKKPVQNILGCAAVARNAFDADSVTSALFLASKDTYSTIMKDFSARFVIFKPDGTVEISENWQGELF